MTDTTNTEAPASNTQAPDASAAKPAATMLGGDSTPPADTKPEAQDAPAGEAKPEAKTEEKPARVAPEKYELAAPEGVALDAAVMTEFEAVARELNMPGEEAQALVNKLAPKLAESMAASQAQAVEKASNEWAEATQADKEIGGDALPQNLAAAKRALDQFGSPELRTLLEQSRLGNHPEVVRFMVRAGKAISEDGFVAGNKAPEAKKPGAQDLYSASNMNP
jgi:hypothetical protein